MVICCTTLTCFSALTFYLSRGETSPSHCISAIQISHDHCTLVTGSHDGQLCVWAMDPNTYQVNGNCSIQDKVVKEIFASSSHFQSY